ncbi:uncharacterized protein BKCO1_5500017 [Diplodia corticola]|uniref:Uncharacterized protein n=1 Tax=Diplodia corticola TaxID=236234 RepID=A0A1J9RR11_9PEZI|nr:uncharacterized protein BKCO1_5500017 [Diplodia corticola]OJD30863.1 hypothetical protein BKCO1_5500017 [Diplodia corticola]
MSQANRQNTGVYLPPPTTQSQAVRFAMRPFQLRRSSSRPTLIDLPPTFYLYSSLTASIVQELGSTLGEMVGCVQCLTPCVTCDQHPEGGRLHCLDCSHVVETKYHEECGSSCIGSPSRQRLDGADKPLPPLPCTTCAYASINWDTIDFTDIVREPTPPRDCTEQSLLGRITEVKARLVRSRAAFEARLKGGRVCEMVILPDDPMDWGERLKDTHIGTVVPMRIQELVPRLIQSSRPPPQPELPTWFDTSANAIPVRRESMLNRGLISREPALNIWRGATPRLANVEQHAEIVEFEGDTEVEQAAETVELEDDAESRKEPLLYETSGPEVMRKSTGEVTQSASGTSKLDGGDDALGHRQQEKDQAAEPACEVEATSETTKIIRFDADMDMFELKLPSEPRNVEATVHGEPSQGQPAYHIQAGNEEQHDNQRTALEEDFESLKRKWQEISACAVHPQPSSSAAQCPSQKDKAPQPSDLPGDAGTRGGEDMPHCAFYGEGTEMAVLQEVMQAGHTAVKDARSLRTETASRASESDGHTSITVSLKRTPRVRKKKNSPCTASEALRTAGDVLGDNSAEALLSISPSFELTLTDSPRSSQVHSSGPIHPQGTQHEARCSVPRSRKTVPPQPRTQTLGDGHPPANPEPLNQEETFTPGKVRRFFKRVFGFLPKLCCFSPPLYA